MERLHSEINDALHGYSSEEIHEALTATHLTPPCGNYDGVLSTVLGVLARHLMAVNLEHRGYYETTQS